VKGLAPRLLAWQALQNLAADRGDWLPPAGDDPDRALARELALGTIRHRSLYRHVTAGFLRGKRQDERLLLVLDLVAHQVFALDRIPDHAIGSTAVALVRACGLPRLSGLVNAVTRRLLALRIAAHLPDHWGPLRHLPRESWPATIADRHHLPAELVAALRLDDEGAHWFNHVQPLCLRRRLGSWNGDEQGLIRSEGDRAWFADVAAAIADHVATGIAVVQDHAQAAPVRLAAVRPGERVLDLCAAPGGKSLAALDAGGRVVAADVNRRRLQRSDAELVRLVQDGHRPAVLTVFDVVLVDAPCSNSGVWGRRPEARLRYHPRSLASLQRCQQHLMTAGADLLRAGGRLVYSTCSVDPAENRLIAEKLAGWQVAAEETALPGPFQAGGYAALLTRC
jgi:16S rRNA (cytosine967-C5)-methyltransferase